MSTSEYLSINKEAQQVITPDQAWHFKAIPKLITKKSIAFYVDENFSSSSKNELEILLGKEVITEIASSEEIQKALVKYYRKIENKNNVEKSAINVKDNFLLNLIEEAKRLGSSDIHIEVYENKCRIRLRIDGLLIERFTLSKEEYPSLINKIKIKANLDISEKRLPQDGRIFFNENNLKFDIRVSILPTLHGEKIVLRLLGNDATNIDIHTLGFSEKDLANYLEGIKKPNGILLISGPTGSGKTTTLYATLKLLNKETSNILTIEDPIEYTLEDINQVQLKETIGLSFAAALKTFLRQDPDIIMLGEIRDAETAQMAIRAALTGHLVLSTIHTNSAWGTIARLTDMGIPTYLIANTLNTSVAQRLVRLLCKHCKEEQAFTKNTLPKNFHSNETIQHHYVAKGCEKCYYTGYKGRKAIYEVIPMDKDITDSIKSNKSSIETLLSEKGVYSLAYNAFQLFKQGETSAEEIYSILISN